MNASDAHWKIAEYVNFWVKNNSQYNANANVDDLVGVDVIMTLVISLLITDSLRIWASKIHLSRIFTNSRAFADLPHVH